MSNLPSIRSVQSVSGRFGCKRFIELGAGVAFAFCLLSCGGDEVEPPKPLQTLNDTGADTCATEASAKAPCPQPTLPGQDAEVGRDAQAALGKLAKKGGGMAGFDWTKLDEQGKPLAMQSAAWLTEGRSADGSQWSCVQDNVTGLMWEVKHSDENHLRYGGHAYAWYLPDATQNGGDAGTVTPSDDQCGTPPCHTAHYVTWLNQQALCGFEDWRMPSVAELLSIAVNSKAVPALDESYFPNANKPRFFTRNTLAKDPKLAWYVYFTDASVSFTNKSDASHVRLVRGGHQ